MYRVLRNGALGMSYALVASAQFGPITLMKILKCRRAGAAVARPPRNCNPEECSYIR